MRLAKLIAFRVVCYWRFNRKFIYTATEAGRFNADVLVSDGKTVIECEIKISKSDLRADFKKRKHAIYKSPSPYYKKRMPNKFYFCVPKKLTKLALELTEGTKYGVIQVQKPKKNFNMYTHSYCVVLKSAENLIDGLPVKAKRDIDLRMSSQLIRQMGEGLLDPSQLDG